MVPRTRKPEPRHAPEYHRKWLPACFLRSRCALLGVGPAPEQRRPSAILPRATPVAPSIASLTMIRNMVPMGPALPPPRTKCLPQAQTEERGCHGLLRAVRVTPASCSGARGWGPTLSPLLTSTATMGVLFAGGAGPASGAAPPLADTLLCLAVNGDSQCEIGSLTQSLSADGLRGGDGGSSAGA
jgi:hypothetical protein